MLKCKILPSSKKQHPADRPLQFENAHLSLVSATDSNNSLNLPSWRDVQEGQLLSRCRQCISNMCEANSRAEKLLESFGKELNCNVCLYLMDHPRKLPCHHAFCRECIETALQHNGCCPVCKQVTKAGLDTVVKRVYPVGNHQAFS